MESRAEHMITRSLTQHRKAFEAIYLDDKYELNRFIASWRGFGYMVVSTKAFIDGEIVAQESGGSSISAAAHVPVDAVMGASTAILPAIFTGLVGFSAGRTETFGEPTVSSNVC